MNNNNFFIELIARFLTKNPKFFRILQLVALILGGLSAGLTYVVNQNVELPGIISWLQNTVVQIVALVTLILAQLPNESPSQKR